MFSVLDKSRNNYLSIDEFSSGILAIFTEKYEVLVELIFNFYDFDKDGKISREDIMVVFSYINLKNNNVTTLSSSIQLFKYENEGDYKYRVESQDEITNYLNTMFEDEKMIDLEQFKVITEEKSSEVFLFVISLVFLFVFDSILGKFSMFRDKKEIHYL